MKEKSLTLKELIKQKKFPFNSSRRNLLDTSDLDTFMEVHEECVKNLRKDVK